MKGRSTGRDAKGKMRRERRCDASGFNDSERPVWPFHLRSSGAGIDHLAEKNPSTLNGEAAECAFQDFRRGIIGVVSALNSAINV
jgi:hypothetical protein